ncbi:MAG: Ig-like domain-containing protein [Lentimicrobiaceae bacterium]|nr:Ig-like domain-containing protein [Lentimicrobiaceae bacterium]
MKNVIKLFSVLFLVSGAVFVSCKDDPKKDPNNPDNWKDPNSEFYRAPVTGVTLSPETLTLAVGEKGTLTATLVPENAYEKSVTWSVEVIEGDGGVATVSDGEVTAISVGKARVEVKTTDGNYTKACVVTVGPKMEENFKIEAIARLYYGDKLYTSDFSVDDIALFASEENKYRSLTYNGEQVSLHLYVKNTSGAIIPAGTPYKFNLKRNGKVVQANIYTGDVIETDGVLTKDVGVNDSYLLYKEIPFYVNMKTEVAGDNQFCVEVLQVGTKEYPSPQTGCCDYKIVQK